MTYQDAIQQLEEMKPRYTSGFSSSDKALIVSLYEDAMRLRFTRTSCNDCYRDAYLQVYNYLKQSQTMEQRKYMLKRGVLLRPEFGSSEYYTTNSMTDAKAEEILAKNPALIAMFDEYPTDWRVRVGIEKKTMTKRKTAKVRINQVK